MQLDEPTLVNPYVLYLVPLAPTAVTNVSRRSAVRQVVEPLGEDDVLAAADGLLLVARAAEDVGVAVGDAVAVTVVVPFGSDGLVPAATGLDPVHAARPTRTMAAPRVDAVTVAIRLIPRLTPRGADPLHPHTYGSVATRRGVTEP